MSVGLIITIINNKWEAMNTIDNLLHDWVTSEG